MAMGSSVRLRELEPVDLALYQAIHCDPRMMEHLGGPLPSEGLAEKLQQDVADVRAGRVWIYVIEPAEASGVAAGTVDVWEREWRGERVNEIGWMVLPEFQGQGLGSRAVRWVLEKARAESRWGTVHAFPPVTNAASNAMCRTMGFTFVEESDFEFRGRRLRCNHWMLDLEPPSP